MEGRLFLVLISLAWPWPSNGSGNGLKRIVNGSNATATQFPYQVFYDIFLLKGNYDDSTFWRPNCGGTLISSQIVLTAAHCFRDDPYIHALRIYFGAVDKSNANESGQQRLIVNRRNVVIHEEYVPHFSYNDIALIKLPFDVTFNEYIRAAKLPQPTNNYVNAKAVVSGWGAYKVSADKQKYFHNHLKYYDINIISNDECRMSLIDMFPSSFICIAPSENSVCFGDSGGPLILKAGEDHILLGVASYVLSSYCTPNLPAIYIRVSSFLDWIREHSDGTI